MTNLSSGDNVFLKSTVDYGLGEVVKVDNDTGLVQVLFTHPPKDVPSLIKVHPSQLKKTSKFKDI